MAPKFIGGLIRREVNGKMVPIFKNSYPERDMEMANCYSNCIRLADKNKLHSIAFPSLGTGGHAYPLEIACPIAIKTTLDTLEKTYFIDKVVFVCFSNNDYDFYKKTLEEIAGF